MKNEIFGILREVWYTITGHKKIFEEQLKHKKEKEEEKENLERNIKLLLSLRKASRSSNIIDQLIKEGQKSRSGRYFSSRRSSNSDRKRSILDPIEILIGSGYGGGSFSSDSCSSSSDSSSDCD